MKITYEVLIGVIDGFVPENERESAMRWVLQNAPKWGGLRQGAGRPKKTDENTQKPTVQVETKKEPTVDENTVFVAGFQGWQFPEQIRTVAQKHFSDDEIREIEKEYSCNEYETKTTIAKLISRKNAVAVKAIEPEIIDKRESMFDAFWATYPKQGRTDKAKAKKKFLSLISGKSGEDVCREIMSGLIAYCKTDRVADGYVKGAYSWLLNEYWKNDWSVVGMKKKTSANAERAAGIMNLIEKYK